MSVSIYLSLSTYTNKCINIGVLQTTLGRSLFANEVLYYIRPINCILVHENLPFVHRPIFHDKFEIASSQLKDKWF